MLLLSKCVTRNSNYNMKLRVLLNFLIWVLVILVPVMKIISSLQWIATLIFLWRLNS